MDEFYKKKVLIIISQLKEMSLLQLSKLCQILTNQD